MVELPAPSFTALPLAFTPDPAGTPAATGAAVAENVMVWPLTLMDLPESPVAATVAARPLESAPEVLASTVELEIASGVLLLLVSALNAMVPLMPPISLPATVAVVPPAAPL